MQMPHQHTNGTGLIVRMKSSYSLRSITVRTTSPTGAAVTSGPTVGGNYPIGYFREDYEYIPTSPSTPDYLDEHNGRFCVTPEYPNGTYCYFATVDANWNSAYPYVVGPTFYGTKQAIKVTSITEPTTTYVPTVGISENFNAKQINIYPNPSSDLLAIQLVDIVKENVDVSLYDMSGRLVNNTKIYQGSTIAYFDTRTLYSGEYFVKLSNNDYVVTKKVTIVKD